MKKDLFKIVLILIALLVSMPTLVSATQISDPNNGEENLYRIINKMVGTNYTSSIDIPQVPDSNDNFWQFSDGQVVIEVRYAGYDQELGLVKKIDNSYLTIVPRADIQNEIYKDGLSYKIDYDKEFAFVEKFWNGTSIGRWYSDDRNSNGSNGSERFDHFVAFDVINSPKYAGSTAINKAYVIAWEDLTPRGNTDSDYNDLVCLVLDVKPTFAEEVIIDAEAEAGRVVLSWTAISETSVLGYNIYRAKGFAGAFEKINDDLIMGKGSIETTVEYEFIDDTVDNGMLYQYKIEEVGTNELSLFHEPVKVVPRFIYNYFR